MRVIAVTRTRWEMFCFVWAMIGALYKAEHQKATYEKANSFQYLN